MRTKFAKYCSTSRWKLQSVTPGWRVFLRTVFVVEIQWDFQLWFISYNVALWFIIFIEFLAVGEILSLPCCRNTIWTACYCNPLILFVHGKNLCKRKNLRELLTRLLQQNKVLLYTSMFVSILNITHKCTQSSGTQVNATIVNPNKKTDIPVGSSRSPMNQFSV